MHGGPPVLDGEPGKAPGSSGGDQGQRGPDGAHRGHPAPTQPQTEQEEPEEFGFDSDRHWSNAYSSVGFYDIPISDVTSLDLS